MSGKAVDGTVLRLVSGEEVDVLAYDDKSVRVVLVGPDRGSVTLTLAELRALAVLVTALVERRL